MTNGQRVKWTSHSGKTRTGTFITKMASRPGFVQVVGDHDGKSHIMRSGKPQPLRQAPEPQVLTTAVA